MLFILLGHVVPMNKYANNVSFGSFLCWWVVAHTHEAIRGREAGSREASRWQSDGVMGGEAWRFLPMVTSDEGVEVSRLHPLPLKGDRGRQRGAGR